MARFSSSKSPKKHNKSSSSSSSNEKGCDRRIGCEKKQGPEEDEFLRTKPMHEVNSIPGLSFEDEENPDGNIQWVTKRGKKTSKHSIVVETEESSEEINETAMEDLLQFPTEDVSEEIAYWNQAVYCFVLGANPHWEFLQRYVHRIWVRHGIDKISFLPNGIFSVRFKEMKDKEEVLNAGYHMFDNKSLIVKPWQEDVDLLTEEVKVIPAWIRIHGLPLKFWGTCLPSIAGLVGPYVKYDAATMEKTRLGFARTMIELKVRQAFPSSVKFRDEYGKIVQLKIEYEWKPILCEKCKGLGHENQNYRKDQHRITQSRPSVKRVWRPIPKANVTNPTVSDKEFPALTTPRLLENSTPEPVAAAGPPVSASEPPDAGNDESTQVEDVIDEEITILENQNNEACLFGLLETKINGVNVGNIAHNMLEGWSVTTNCSLHKGGRVWLLWPLNIFEVHIIQYDPQFIHSKIIIKTTKKVFFITIVYVFNEGSERLDLWDKLRSIASHCAVPWALAGDFNTVISSDEILGAASKQEDMDAFIDCLSACGMIDIPTTGAFFTWTNKQESNHRKYSRLDRFLVNQEWIDEFPDMHAHFHPGGLMDHTPCIVRNIRFDSRRSTSFKYFNMWSGAPDFLETVKNTWSQQISGTKMFGVIEDQTGKLCTDTVSIQEAFLNFNQGLLGSKKGTEHVRSEVLQTGSYCNENHTISLLAPVTKEEIKGVVFSIPIDKAPGPDGYTSGFFRDLWDIVGDEVCNAIMDFFDTGCPLTQINTTNITLIPKCDRPTAVSHFRPIACCNLVYKVISKLLCNRLALVLPDIHENQGAFIKGRSIVENVLICQDIINLYARKAVTLRYLFKIDLQKAYDTVE
ncbi:uncharacterized protein LOC141640960 [Silene latifolia]|uniref:uncharacterized protein LOC141640960 n=1 Tax=Silene latifolia TaxID=37657 RepID=UPI003D7783A9